MTSKVRYVTYVSHIYKVYGNIQRLTCDYQFSMAIYRTLNPLARIGKLSSITSSFVYTAGHRIDNSLMLLKGVTRNK